MGTTHVLTPEGSPRAPASPVDAVAHGPYRRPSDWRRSVSVPSPEMFPVLEEHPPPTCPDGIYQERARQNGAALSSGDVLNLLYVAGHMPWEAVDILVDDFVPGASPFQQAVANQLVQVDGRVASICS